jgi:ribosomal protein L33
MALAILSSIRKYLKWSGSFSKKWRGGILLRVRATFIITDVYRQNVDAIKQREWEILAYRWIESHMKNTRLECNSSGKIMYQSDMNREELPSRVTSRKNFQYMETG